MSSLPPIDPHMAVGLLVDEISGANNKPGEISRLISAIDTFTYSLQFIGLDIPTIERGEVEPPQFDYRETYEAVKERYSTLGNYWLALHAIIQDDAEGELAVGDAIDDLVDILNDLREVQWLGEHVDRRNALAALRTRYDMHLWMHVHSLRQYLEEMKR